MTLQTLYRNYLTKLIIGKYNIDKISNKALLKDEEYISSIDILFYDEMLIILAILLATITLYLTQFSLVFISFLIIPVLLLYYGIEVEIIILTSERVIIERRGLIEKILRVKNIRSVSIDQIALFSYARAPFNLAALFVALISTLYLLELFQTPVNLSQTNAPDLVITSIFIIFAFAVIYLIWYGLRLNKRSIEMAIIGLTRTIGIGRRKGAPQWFVDDMEMMIYDRIHHIFHTDDTFEIKIEEFPLDYNSNLKELLRQTEKPIQRKIIEKLADKSLTKKQLIEIIPGYSKIEIDEAMRQLRKIQFIFYDRSRRIWCLNKQYVMRKNNEIKLDDTLIKQIYPMRGNDLNIITAIELLGINWVIEQVGLHKVVEEIGLTKIIHEVDFQHLIQELQSNKENKIAS